MKLIATVDVKERVTHLEQEDFRDNEDLHSGFYYLTTWHAYIPCVSKNRNSIYMYINPNQSSIDLYGVELSLKELQKFCDSFCIDLFINFPRRMEV